MQTRMLRGAVVGMVGLSALAACLGVPRDDAEQSDSSSQFAPDAALPDVVPPVPPQPVEGGVDAVNAYCSSPDGGSGPAWEWLGVVSEGSCRDFAIGRGTWHGRMLFPDAPEPLRSTTCAFHWETADGTPPTYFEIGRLTDHVPNMNQASCEPSGVTAGMGTVTLIGPVVDPPPAPPSDDPDAEPPPTGVSGCDVCGQVAGDRLYVVLPPVEDFTHAKLKTTTSLTIELVVTPPSATSDVFSVSLPPPPSGSWVEGYVKLE